MLKGLFLVLALVGASLYAEVWEARAVRVIDGETFVALRNHEQVKVKLAEICTPEEGMIWSQEAKEGLKSQIIGKVVTVDQKGVDQSGRVVAVVWTDKMNINAWMVQQGHAWVGKKYMKNFQLVNIEQKARKKHVGLWSQQHIR